MALATMNQARCRPPLDATEVEKTALSICKLYAPVTGVGSGDLTTQKSDEHLPSEYQLLALYDRIRATPEPYLVYDNIYLFAPLSEAKLVLATEELKKLIPRLRRDDFRRAVRAERVRQESAKAPVPDLEYAFKDGRLIRFKYDRNNKGEEIPLAEFEACITADILEDDGAERRRFFGIEAKIGSVERNFLVPANRFNAMEWPIEYLGAGAVVYPGQREWARTGIQRLSTNVEERITYAHTGWRKVNGGWAYLHAGGGIGPDGAVAGIDVRLHGPLAGYQLLLPQDNEQRKRAVQSTLKILRLAPFQIVFPLLAATVRACIRSCDFAVWLVGPTGTFKSEAVALAQQHYGAGMNARHLPGNFASTANCIETLAFLAKDALLVVDDFAPAGGSQDIARYHSTADRILRAAGNNQGRGRLRSDATLHNQRPPRGLILATGEDSPRSHSDSCTHADHRSGASRRSDEHLIGMSDSGGRGLVFG